MSVDVIEDLVRVFKGSVPQDITRSAVGVDIIYTIATMLEAVEAEVTRLAAEARMGTSTGLYLDLHARDRGLRRQSGETDDQLRERLRKPPLAGTVLAIQQAVALIVGDAGAVYVIEIPRQGMFFDRNSFLTSATDTGFTRSLPQSGQYGSRMGGHRGVVVVLIPEAADAVESVTDAVRSKVSAGKLWLIQEYV